MSESYLKMDTIMRNMFVAALHQVLTTSLEQSEDLEGLQLLQKKIRSFQGKRLPITGEEQTQIYHALIMLRNCYLEAGRYSDGIDSVLMKVMKPKKSKHFIW